MTSSLSDLRGSRRLQTVLAVESAECGLACMAMIANYWGHQVDLNGLRRRHEVSTSGLSLKALIDLSSGLGCPRVRFAPNWTAWRP